MKITLGLAKHPHENRFLTKWYEVRFGTTDVVQFRSDKFVPESIEKKLNNLHVSSKITNYQQLLDAAKVLLQPFAHQIISDAKNYLEAFDVEKENAKGFVFNDPNPFTVVKKNGKIIIR